VALFVVTKALPQTRQILVRQRSRCARVCRWWIEARQSTWSKQALADGVSSALLHQEVGADVKDVVVQADVTAARVT
jgi:hypothetical protein